jgi:putative nucleotidyltransferase with HDIG domain
MTRHEYLDKILAKVTDVPTLPASVLQVMQMIEDPLCSAADLSRVIVLDPSMAAKVLKLANSPFYGFRQKIGNIPQAVTLLGFATLKNALLSAAVFDMFRISGTGLDMQGLWKHSVGTATAAKLVSKRVRFPNSEKAFTAGLLHDIGKVIIARYLPSSLHSVMQMVRDEHLAMFDAEQKTIGLAHPSFGGWVMAKWGLPTALVEAVEFHHHPTRSKFAFDLAGIVYLANIMAHRCNLGSGGDVLMREVDPLVLEYFSLNEGSLYDLQDMLVTKRLEIESFAGIASAV